MVQSEGNLWKEEGPSLIFVLPDKNCLLTCAFDLHHMLDTSIRERTTHKHKRMWGMVPGLGGCNFVHVFVGVIPYGGAKHINENSQKIACLTMAYHEPDPSPLLT